MLLLYFCRSGIPPQFRVWLCFEEAFETLECDAAAAHLGNVATIARDAIESNVGEWGSFDWARDPAALQSVGSYGLILHVCTAAGRPMLFQSARH